MRLMVLHDVKNEDGIKSFFNEVYETFIKVSCPIENIEHVQYVLSVFLQVNWLKMLNIMNVHVLCKV